MFAIFLTDAMDPFYKVFISFPTVVFSFFLVLSIFFWMLAVLGAVDLDFLGIDGLDPELDVGGSDGVVHFLGAVMFRFGLNGVPFPIVFTLVSIVSWFLSFGVCFYLVSRIGNGLLEFLIGIPVFFGVLFVSTMITGWMIRPVRPMFIAMTREHTKKILGQVAIVRTSRIDESFGEAVVEDGGAGLIVKVRSYGGEKFERGDSVVLLEHNKVENTYRVVSEKEFNRSL